MLLAIILENMLHRGLSSLTKVHDLSMTISPGMFVWPGDPTVLIKDIATYEREGYKVELYSSTTHTGTHIDAPAHMLKDGKAIDEIDPSSFVQEGYVMRLPSSKQEISEGQIKMLWNDSYDDKSILINTGWCDNIGKRQGLDFPGLSLEAAHFLVERGIKMVGIDTLGIEPYSHPDFAVHKFLLKHGVVIIECLSNLGELIEGKKYLIIALPIKLKNSGGSMARVIALDVE